MKLTLQLLPVFAAIFALSAFASDDIAFQVEKKRSGMERTKTLGTQTSQEKWGYHVALINQSFKPMTNIEVRYAFFTKSEVFGSDTGKAKEGKQTGMQKIDSFKSNDKFEFDTAAVELKKTQLLDGYFVGGAKPKANATLEGIWLRIYQDGKMTAEFCQPNDLKSKKKW